MASCPFGLKLILRRADRAPRGPLDRPPDAVSDDELAVDGPSGDGRTLPTRDHADLFQAQNHRIEGPSEVQRYEFGTVSVK